MAHHSLGPLVLSPFPGPGQSCRVPIVDGVVKGGATQRSVGVPTVGGLTSTEPLTRRC